MLKGAPSEELHPIDKESGLCQVLEKKHSGCREERMEAWRQDQDLLCQGQNGAYGSRGSRQGGGWAEGAGCPDEVRDRQKAWGHPGGFCKMRLDPE